MGRTNPERLEKVSLIYKRGREQLCWEGGVGVTGVEPGRRGAKRTGGKQVSGAAESLRKGGGSGKGGKGGSWTRDTCRRLCLPGGEPGGGGRYCRVNSYDSAFISQGRGKKSGAGYAGVGGGAMWGWGISRRRTTNSGTR